VSAVHKFLSAVIKGDEPEVSISEWLASIGMEVDDDGSNPRTIKFPAVLLSTWKMNDGASRRAILMEREVVGPDHCLNNYIHKGLWYLENLGVDTSAHVEKLQRMGGASAMLREINTYRIETGLGPTLRTCAVGIVRLLNHGRRTRKIRLPVEGRDAA
jgi:hypothetical protein